MIDLIEDEPNSRKSCKYKTISINCGVDFTLDVSKDLGAFSLKNLEPIHLSPRVNFNDGQLSGYGVM